MSSVVHFKFRNALLQDMVNFDGDHVSLADLKRLIAKKKGLIKAIDIDFAVTNQETGEGMNRLVYRDACTDGACGRKVELVRADAFHGVLQSTPIRACSFRKTQESWCVRSMPRCSHRP